MTQEQFDRANHLQNKIKHLKDKNNAFERVIDRLKGTQMQDIQIRLNDAWVAKVKQVFDKARRSYGDESDFNQIEELYRYYHSVKNQL